MLGEVADGEEDKKDELTEQLKAIDAAYAEVSESNNNINLSANNKSANNRSQRKSKQSINYFLFDKNGHAKEP